LIKKSTLIIIIISIGVLKVQAQISGKRNFSSNNISYANPREYIIGGVTVEGANFTDQNAIIGLSGLIAGEKIKIPSDKTAKAIQNLWSQELFENINIEISKFQNDYVFLTIKVQERPRLSRYNFKGVRKSESDELKEKINITRGKIVNDNLINTSTYKIKKYFIEKGYLDVEVSINESPDTILANSVKISFEVKKGNRVKIAEINFVGNTSIEDKTLKRSLKETKEKRPYLIFKSSRYLEDKFDEDKISLIEKYNEKGYRDARILKDSVYKVRPGRVGIDIKVTEGPQYHFGDITWVGNTKYDSTYLAEVLGIEKGEIFNQTELTKRLSANPSGRDVSSLYLDDGYLFFRVNPIEKKVTNDTIDLEINIVEGSQATINKVTVVGNQKTNDRVILRELRTKPGMKFSRSDITRSIRELSQLNYFDPAQLNVNPQPHPESGTVDLEYIVAEKPSDQIELSGGVGGGRIVGTLGVSFNNFSTKNLFSKNWKSYLPTGDGQRLSLRAQSNGLFFQSYNFSFAEPWLGGKKPIYFGINLYHTTQSNGFRASDARRLDIKINGASLTIGQRLKKPDDYFQFTSTLSFQEYILNGLGGFVFNKGRSYNFNLQNVISRNSLDQPIFPSYGSVVQFTVQATPPFSAFNGKDYSNAELADKYRYIEYHKWKFESSYFIKLLGKMVLNPRMQYGFIGYYNKDIGISPFERYKLGGDGLTGFNFFIGSEVIALRGYPNNSLSADQGSPIFSKYTIELRQPIVMNQSVTLFGLAFVEGGRTWERFTTYNPFNVYRSVGMGVRIYLPIFGLLGLDYGIGLDDVPGLNRTNPGQFHFYISQQIGSGF
jgi:outer membrane protein insertion porin family